MFKRLLWLVIGAGFGLGLSFWVSRLLRHTVTRYSPERVSGELRASLERLGADLREALAEGRRAMQETEDDLRARLEGVAPPRPGEPEEARRHR